MSQDSAGPAVSRPPEVGIPSASRAELAAVTHTEFSTVRRLGLDSVQLEGFLWGLVPVASADPSGSGYADPLHGLRAGLGSLFRTLSPASPGSRRPSSVLPSLPAHTSEAP